MIKKKRFPVRNNAFNGKLKFILNVSSITGVTINNYGSAVYMYGLTSRIIIGIISFHRTG